MGDLGLARADALRPVYIFWSQNPIKDSATHRTGSVLELKH